MSYSEAVFAYIDPYLSRLGEFLVSLGVPPEQGRFAAMVTVYLGLTLLVLLLVFLLLRARRKEAERPAPAADKAREDGAEEPSDASVEELEASPETVAEEADEREPAFEDAAVGSEQEPPAEIDETVAPPPAEPVLEPVSEAGLFGRLRQGLAKTRSSLQDRFEALLEGHPRLDEEFTEELEEILITADFGMQATQELVDALGSRLQKATVKDAADLYDHLREEIRARLPATAPDWPRITTGPLVIMVVGVNGVGKTTTIGKLARRFSDEGKKVVLGAGDTFRAAAAEQLQIWGERAGADVIRQAEGSDPAAVAFDAVKAALARQADVLILDTAGRLHTKVNLMEELKKVRRVIDREIPGAPHETLLVLDATTGQNALIQAKMFQEAVEVDSVALTKLDGTAKGGIVVAINAQLGLPVRLIGVGEGVADLRPFVADDFVAALFDNS